MGKVYIVSDVPLTVIQGMDVIKGLNMKIDFSNNEIEIRDSAGSSTVTAMNLSKITAEAKPAFKSKPQLCDKVVNHVKPQQKFEFDEFLLSWKDRFENLPGRCKVFKHKIYVNSDTLLT